jgi:hypothetical protein
VAGAAPLIGTRPVTEGERANADEVQLQCWCLGVGQRGWSTAEGLLVPATQPWPGTSMLTANTPAVRSWGHDPWRDQEEAKHHRMSDLAHAMRRTDA